MNKTIREQFNEDFSDLDSLSIQKELLYQILKSNNISEKIRKDVNYLYWWIVVIPIIFGLIYLFLAGFMGQMH